MHKKKTAEDKNLNYIKREGKLAEEVAYEVLEMYKEDFNMSISEIVLILRCERQWVLKNIKDNVKHIFLNKRYRDILKCYEFDDIIIDVKKELNDYYYFSRKDFNRWLLENTISTKQTQAVDIIDHCNKSLKFNKAKDELFQTLFKTNNEIIVRMAMLDFKDKIISELTPLGKQILKNSVGVTKRKGVEPVTIDNVFPERFASIKDLKEEYGKSLEIIYRDLYKFGAVKYTIADSLVRYDSNFFTAVNYNVDSFLVTMPYEYYLNNVLKQIKKMG